MNVSIYVFDEVEVLDFAGPFEVFSTASRVYAREHEANQPPLFDVVLISDKPRIVEARGGLLIQTRQALSDDRQHDVLLVPGGVVRDELEQSNVIRWIASTAKTAQVTASVCTGAFLLAAAGLLDGKRATTHWEDIDEFRQCFPAVRVEMNSRWIDEGAVITSAGISAGIDMSLHLVRRLAGPELARATARQMDFTWDDRGS